MLVAFQTFIIVLGIVLSLVMLGLLFSVLRYIPLWINVRAAGLDLSPLQMFGMQLRHIDPHWMMENLIELHKAGLTVDQDSMEAHVLAGGDIEDVVNAAISADKAGLGIGLEQLCAIQLAGRDVVRAVDACVNPQVIACPSITAVAQDGIRMRAKVRITVRSDINRLIGGAGQETIIARVGEGIVSAIGQLEKHNAVLQRPELISRYILERGLDSGTIFEIMSVDVSEVDIIDNVGARLQEEQAESDKKVAQARAEMRRSMAVATEREMRARVVEMTSQVTANQATIPLAMADAARQGRIWRSPHPVKPVFGHQLWDSSER